MNPDQAYQILDYGIPQERAGYLSVLAIIGCTEKLRGRPLSRCEDQQLFMVTQRLRRQAREVAQADKDERKRLDLELKAELKAMHEEDELIHYKTFLSQCLNLSEEESESMTIGELEERITH